MDFFDGPHYRINKVLLCILAGTQIIAKLCAIVVSFDDTNIVLENLSPIIADMGGLIKLVNSTLKMKKVLKVMYCTIS
ncbi:hypothetical protein KPH14_005863 [Odynerus spinipes]|uniref:Uncharacterized protein n=1 Tax=Odynerus spinipes TaxID=1348599 RepID=A0AAD9RGN4_9HYME|nr:hypothetical protein KPH14_005863 [Odynerus spinipes]